MSAGVLKAEQITTLFDKDPPAIKRTGALPVKPGRSSVDLPLGDKYYELPASCRPHEKLAVTDFIRYCQAQKKPLEPGTKFERKKIYLVETPWQAELPNNFCARSTARSSIGRLDALVRLVADHQSQFDRIKAIKEPPGLILRNLYVEVFPITFDLLVSPFSVLSQLRFMKGSEHHCTVSRECLALEDPPVLVKRNEEPAELREVEGDPNAVLLSLDLTPDPQLGFPGFVAKRNKDIHAAVDPFVREDNDSGKDNRHDPHEYWEPVEYHGASSGSQEEAVRIDIDRFYIFRSKERFRVPLHLAVDCRAYSESLGDIRIHYAGFAHPGFGFSRKEGTPLMFEVRGHNMPTILRDGDALAKLYFRRMSKPLNEKELEAEEYDEQELQLSGCFKDWK